MDECHELIVCPCPSKHGPELSAQSTTLDVLLSCAGKQELITIYNPFSVQEETEYKWYLKEFPSKQPFESSRAKRVSESLDRYGRSLAAQLLASDILPWEGNLNLRIDFKPRNHLDPFPGYGYILQSMHWEILEAVSSWPRPCRYASIRVRRTLSESGPQVSYPRESSKVRILLVTCRPKGREDIDSQLISRAILRTLQGTATTPVAVDVRLKILRPPTWLAFKEHLLYECEPGHYQLIHFDMHGEILDADTIHSK